MAQAFVWKSTPTTSARVETHFYSQNEWNKAVEEGLLQGFFFAATKETLNAYEIVELRLVLPSGQPVDTKATVVQVMPGAGLTLQIKPELLPSLLQVLQNPSTPPAPTTPPPETEFPSTPAVAVEEVVLSEEDVSDSGEAVIELDDGDDLDQERQLSLREQIRAMTVSERMRYAARAGRSGRMLLVTDHNPNVMKFLIRNPRIGREEVHRLLMNNRITPDILNIIAKERKWNSSEELRMLLIRHPKTPSGVVMKLMNSISERNLRTLARSSNVKDSIKRTALQKLDKLRRSRGY